MIIAYKAEQGIINPSGMFWRSRGSGRRLGSVYEVPN